MGWGPRKDPKRVDRDKRILEMARDNYPYKAIAAEVGLSYQRVGEIVNEFYYEQVLPARDEARRAQIQRLEAYRQEILLRLKKHHIVVQHGKIVRLEDPETGEKKPLEDSEAALKCVDRLLKVEEQLAKMQGTFAPTQVDTRILEMTQQDQAVDDLIREAEKQSDLTKRELTGEEPPPKKRTKRVKKTVRKKLRKKLK